MVSIRDYLATMWTDNATVYEYQNVTDPITHKTSRKLTPVYRNIPCRISFSGLSPTAIGNDVANVSQNIKLFLDTEYTIKEGSVIQVTRNGKVEKYRRSGVPAIYDSHQEIVLEKYEDFA